MKRFVEKKFLESLIVTGIALLFASLNLYHVFYWWFHKPPQTVFIGISHWYQDYFYYLSHLMQGRMGQWTLVNKYTTEIIPQGVSWWFNLWLGKISYILPLPIWAIYDATIFILSVIYILFMYIVLKTIYPTNSFKRLGALLITLASTNLFLLEGERIIPITYFYAYTSSLNRLGGIAHHVAQNLLSLMFIFIAAKIIDVANRSKFKSELPHLIKLTTIGALILVFLFIISAFYVAMDILVFGLVAAFYLLLHGNKSYLARLAMSFGILVTPILPIAYYQAQALRDPFWIFVRDWEANIPPTNVPTFILSSGLIVLFICFGVVPFLKKLTPLRALGFAFATIPILLYFSPLPNLLHTPSFRFLQPPAYVFLGAIAIEGISLLTTLAKSYKRSIFLLLVGLFLVVQLPVLLTEVKERTSAYFLNSSFNFVPQEIFEGLVYLRKLPHDKNVLAFHTLETLVPVISGHTVYTGHGTLTVHYNEKNLQTRNFYSGLLTPNQAYDLLTQNSIGFVLWKTTDGDSARFTTVYPFLTKIWENPMLEIYTVERIK